MWMQLPFDIRGKRYSISLISFLCWLGFALTQHHNNAANVFGLPKWLAITLLLLLMILTTIGTSRVDTDSTPEPIVTEDE
jgi:uncharacterized membrane protein YhdT